MNQIKANINKKTILDTQNELYKNIFEGNIKYNKAISELTKIRTKSNIFANKYTKNNYYNFKIYFFKLFSRRKKNRFMKIQIEKKIDSL